MLPSYFGYRISKKRSGIYCGGSHFHLKDNNGTRFGLVSNAFFYLGPVITKNLKILVERRTIQALKLLGRSTYWDTTDYYYVILL